MPKIKKSKAVSLVSAYESGAESDASDEENELSEEESTSERSSSSTASSKIKPLETATTTSEIETVEFTVKNEINQSDNSVHVEEILDESHKREVISEITQETHELQSDNLKDDETTSVEQSKDTSQSIYTLENGFPAGCEHIRLPPEPKAQCSQTLQNKISQVVERMKRYNYSINEDIHKKKSFKNPSIYEKLIESHGIDEFGSNFPDHIDNLKEHGYMFYDELDEAQRADWARKEKERKERTKIEMVSATKKK